LPPDTALSAAQWLEVRITPARDAELVTAALFALGCQGIQEDGSDVVTHFPATLSDADIRSAILAADPAAIVRINTTEAVDWSGWRADVRSHRVGGLTVTPPWLAAGLDPASTIVIEPEMAFGTGEHATTRGVMQLMQRVVTPESFVADLGAGSAVLSIAAAKLGAGRVAAIELDTDAAGNALSNIRANEVADRVHFIEGDACTILPLIAPVDIVLANILSSLLIKLLPVIHSSLGTGGHAILSGILAEERGMMLECISRGDWRVDDEYLEGEWWSVLITRL
jgi:ribosomal protein L11 methyltransferase